MKLMMSNSEGMSMLQALQSTCDRTEITESAEVTIHCWFLSKLHILMVHLVLSAADLPRTTVQ